MQDGLRLHGDLEDNVLCALCWHETLSLSMVLSLTPELFSNKQHRQIAQKAFAFIERFGKPPRLHLSDLLEDELRHGEDGKLLHRMLEFMQMIAPELHADYVTEQLDGFIATRQLTMAMAASQAALAEGDVQKARDLLYGNTISVDRSPGTWLHDDRAALAFLDRHDEDVFSSGIDVLDERGVRPARATLFLLIAAAKMGKSWMMIELGKRALLMQKQTVLHISLENSQEMTAQRYVQALFGMTQTEDQVVQQSRFVKQSDGSFVIEPDTLIPEAINSKTRAKVAARLRRLKQRPRLLIKHFPTGTLTVPQLNAYLDMLARNYDFRPDLLLVDYPDLMATRGEHLRADLGRIFQQLRGIAVARNIALAAPTQGNRISGQVHTVNTSMVAEDWSKIGTADVVLTYSQTPAEKKLGLARIMVAAARNARDRYMVLITQSYETAQFCLDSVYMSGDVFTEHKRVTHDE